MEEKIHNLKNHNCRWFTRDSSLVEPEVALKDMQKGGKIQNAVQWKYKMQCTSRGLLQTWVRLLTRHLQREPERDQPQACPGAWGLPVLVSPSAAASQVPAGGLNSPYTLLRLICFPWEEEVACQRLTLPMEMSNSFLGEVFLHHLHDCISRGALGWSGLV